MNRLLESFSRLATAWAGSAWAFLFAVLVVVIWAVSGPFFGYSETWQLVINTGTTIVTFLMVFLIQRAQNKESQAIQIKLNELLASQKGASNRLINVEDMSEEDIALLHTQFVKLSKHLEDASEECNAHSITEAKDALEDVKDSLQSLQSAH